MSSRTGKTSYGIDSALCRLSSEAEQRDHIPYVPGSSPGVGNGRLGEWLIQRTFNPHIQVRFLYRSVYVGLAQLGKRLVHIQEVIEQLIGERLTQIVEIP